MRTSRQARSTLASLVAVPLVGIACSQASSAPANGRSPEQGTPLETRRGTFEQRVLLAGLLEAADSVQITAPRTPTWQVQVRWMAEDGASVEAGQKILELDNSAFTADLEEKRLTARKNEKELQQQRAQKQAEAAEKRFAVEQRLVELDKARIAAAIPEDLIPKREHQEAQLALQKAKTAHEKAEGELATLLQTTESELEIGRVALAQIHEEIRRAEKAINDLTIAAPRDGVVIIGDMRREGRRVQIGDNVWPGFVIMRIPDLEKMRVTAHLSDVDDGQLAPGMQASVELESYPELTFRGTIRDITPVAQELSPRSLRRAFRVRVELDETDTEIMRPGMAARVTVTTRRVEQALLVPRGAIDFSRGTPRVLAEDGEQLGLELGPCNARVCVAESELGEGRALRSVQAGAQP